MLNILHSVHCRPVLLACCLLFRGMTIAEGVRDTDTLDLGRMIQPADPSHFLRDPDAYTWCNSIIKGPDGRYHLFFSRWPKALGFYAWLTHSEVVHATADHPEGPYTHQALALPAGRGPGHWDQYSAHNPKIKQFEGKYWLYYTATNDGGKNLPLPRLHRIIKEGWSKPDWWPTLGRHQRTGVAVSDTLNGPWKPLEQPIVEPSEPIMDHAVNPAVTQMPNGRYVLIIKGRDAKTPNRFRLIQAVGTSDRPEGPFTLEKKAAFRDVPTEDASIWFDPVRKRYYAIYHALGNNYLGLITSEDGRNWKSARHAKVCPKQVRLTDGSLLPITRMERPSVFCEDGVPRVLSVAVETTSGDAFIVFIPLRDSAN